MIYTLIIVGLFVAMLLYFRIADRYNIIDKPNERSSHTQVTIRGGGVIFYLGALAWFIWSGCTWKRLCRMMGKRDHRPNRRLYRIAHTPMDLDELAFAFSVKLLFAR